MPRIGAAHRHRDREAGRHQLWSPLRWPASTRLPSCAAAAHRPGPHGRRPSPAPRSFDGGLRVAWPNPARAPASPNHHSPSPGPAAPFNQASVPSRPHRLAHAADRLRGTAQNIHSTWPTGPTKRHLSCSFWSHQTAPQPKLQQSNSKSGGKLRVSIACPSRAVLVRSELADRVRKLARRIRRFRVDQHSGCRPACRMGAGGANFCRLLNLRTEIWRTYCSSRTRAPTPSAR